MAEVAMEAVMDVSGETTITLNGEVPKEVVENVEDLRLSEEYMKNPLLQPTNKTAEEIVAEIMAEVSDEGVLSSLAKMGELQNDLESKIKNMQSSFEEQMASIQADISKYWEIDKEYEKYHVKIDELCTADGEKPASQQIREMVDAFKEGQYKDGLEKVTSGDDVIDGVLTTDQDIVTTVQSNQPQSGDSTVMYGVNHQNNVSTEEVLENVSSEVVPPIGIANGHKQKVSNDQGRGKSPKPKKTSEDSKSKSDDVKGRKTLKKKGIKS